MTSHIYIITNIANSKTYVGKTNKSIDARLAGHIRASKNKTSTLYFHNAIRKYGGESFKTELLETTTRELASSREIFYISTLNPNYNLSKGGEGYSPRIKRQWITNGKESRFISVLDQIPEGFWNGVSDTHREKLKNINSGRIHTTAARENMSAGATGKILTAETKTKMSEVRKGKVFSKITKDKMSASGKAGWAKRKEQMVRHTWITNGLMETQILSSLLIPAGFVVGRLGSTRSKCLLSRLT